MNFELLYKMSILSHLSEADRLFSESHKSNVIYKLIKVHGLPAWFQAIIL